MNAATNLKPTFESEFLHRYGPLLSHDQMANLLDKTPGGLRAFLLQRSKLAVGLLNCKVQVGRRNFYRTIEVAELLSCRA